jgi:hypothetical protein
MTSGVDQEGSTATIPGVSHSVFFRTKRARSGFYGDEPLLWGERRQSGWGIFCNRDGILSAWMGYWPNQRQVSFSIDFDWNAPVTMPVPGFVVHLWLWHLHMAVAIAFGRVAKRSRSAVVDRSRSTPSP